MRLRKNEFYYETRGFINIVTVTGGSERVKKIEYFFNGIKKYNFAVVSEMFKNKKDAIKYYGHKMFE